MYSIKKSNIHGNGVFSNKYIPKNKYIDIGIEMKFSGYLPVITKGFGDMLNHSYNPNCRLFYRKKDSHYWIIANKNIGANTELTVDYRFTPWFIDGPKHFYK